MKSIIKIFNNLYLYNLAQFFFGMDFYKVAAFHIKKFPHKSIIEIGCGTALLLKHISIDRYLGVDMNEDYINYARKKHKKNGVTFLVEDANKLKKINENFDLLIMFNIIHHLSENNLNAIIKNLIRNVKFSRIIVLDSKPVWPFGWFLEKIDQGDNFRELDEIAGIFSRHFTVEKTIVLRKPYWLYKYPMVVARNK